MLLLFAMTTLSGTFAFQWTSSSMFPNGTRIKICIGDNVLLPWTFTTYSADEIFIEWIQMSDGQEKSFLASYSQDTFLKSNSKRVLEFVPNAGLFLSDMTLSDTGSYSVQIHVRNEARIYEQSAFVRVSNQLSEPPVTLDEGLRAFILPEGYYQVSTKQWHAQLGCGKFLSRDQPSVSVIWKTPSDRIINSTSYKDHVSILTLPNPAEEGDYSCFLDRAAIAEQCLQSHFNLSRLSDTAATVNIKETDIRLVLLEALWKQNAENITEIVQELKIRNEKLSSALQELVYDQFGRKRIPSKDDLERQPRSCQDVKNYNPASGIHTIYLSNNININVYCDQTTDNGGWLVIQRRQDGSVDFNRTWEQYQLGFGNLSTEFWIGLTNLYILTKNQNFRLRVDLTEFDGTTTYAVYKTFNISDGSDNYRLRLSGYSGTAADNLGTHNNKQFSTPESDHDTYISGNCAQMFAGGWWFGACFEVDLNGLYQPRKVIWGNRIIKRVEMKIKL